MFFMKRLSPHTYHYHLHGNHQKSNEQRVSHPFVHPKTHYKQQTSHQHRSQSIRNKKRIEGFQIVGGSCHQQCTRNRVRLIVIE